MSVDNQAGVDLAYDLDKVEWGVPDVDLEVIAHQYGGQWVSSGTGFGQRDLQFEFPHILHAHAFCGSAMQNARANGYAFAYLGCYDLDAAFEFLEAVVGGHLGPG